MYNSATTPNTEASTVKHPVEMQLQSITSTNGPQAEPARMDSKQPAKITMNVPAFFLPKIRTTPAKSPAVLPIDKRLADQPTGIRSQPPMTSAEMQKIINTYPSIKTPVSVAMPPLNASQFEPYQPLQQMWMNSSVSMSISPQTPVILPPEVPQHNVPHVPLNLYPKFCNVPGCYRPESPNTFLFSAPPDMTRHWSDILGIDNTQPFGSVCSQHFSPDQFFSSPHGVNLLPNALPNPMLSPPTSVPVNNAGSYNISEPLSQISSTPSSKTPEPHEVMINSSAVSIKTISSNQEEHSPPQNQLAKKPNNEDLSQTNPPNQELLIQTTNKNTQPPAPVQIQTVTIISPNRSQTSPEKTNNIGKVRAGPKCFRQTEKQSKATISLGPYARPKVPVNLKCADLTKEEFTLLVMPSDNWSVAVYPVPNQRQGKLMYVISETLLTSDLVEIVRKSISIQPNWAMKFSVMATDASHFNLGVGASEISDIQAILDNFDDLPVCSGCFDSTLSKNIPNHQGKITIFSDKKCRSIECPLLLVRATGKSCPACVKLRNNC